MQPSILNRFFLVVSMLNEPVEINMQRLSALLAGENTYLCILMFVAQPYDIQLNLCGVDAMPAHHTLINENVSFTPCFLVEKTTLGSRILETLSQIYVTRNEQIDNPDFRERYWSTTTTTLPNDTCGYSEKGRVNWLDAATCHPIRVSNRIWVSIIQPLVPRACLSGKSFLDGTTFCMYSSVAVELTPVVYSSMQDPEFVRAKMLANRAIPYHHLYAFFPLERPYQ